MSAVRATFEDVKRVKTRKVWQLIFEVPEENYDAAIETLGGSPRSGTDRWVGIAPVTAPGTTAERPKGGERAKRAGILCNDTAFQAWADGMYIDERAQNIVEPPSGHMTFAAKSARWQLCAHLRIKNLRMLDHDDLAGGTFDQRVQEFYASQRGDTDKARIAQRDRA